jgi:hypothetical protein
MFPETAAFSTYTVRALHIVSRSICCSTLGSVSSRYERASRRDSAVTDDVARSPTVPITLDGRFRCAEVSVDGFGSRSGGTSRPGEGVPQSPRNRSFPAERRRDAEDCRHVRRRARSAHLSEELPSGVAISNVHTADSFKDVQGMFLRLLESTLRQRSWVAGLVALPVRR